VTAPSPDRPLMISVPVSPYVELARWTLDRLAVDYHEERHAPVFNTLAARRHGGSTVVPVLDVGASSLTDARQIVEYYEQRAPEHLRLYPADPAERAEAHALFDECFDVLGVAVRAWAYAYQLPLRRSTTRAWVDGAPRHERLLVPLVYPLIARRLRAGLKLHAGSIPEQRAIIDASFARLQERLADGRRYLVGGRLTAADLALATLVAPAVLPPGYRGPLPGFDELPAPMQREVRELQAHPVGRFALRLYADERDGAAT
jgi:glutathione S-transferase